MRESFGMLSIAKLMEHEHALEPSTTRHMQVLSTTIARYADDTQSLCA